MPTRRYVCRQAGCGALIDQSGYCPRHLAAKRRRYDQEQRPERHKLYHSARWQQLRKIKLNLNPICEDCKDALAEQVHHRLSVDQRPDLAFDLANLESLCASCHSTKTATEMKSTGVW
jgi:5-methylcytosine-specific restriction protein A